MIRLSFIVPFYGVEKYIEECIRSLYDQDIPMEEYEVICVDDCSPDGSRDIVERLQKEYPMLKLLIHRENKRQGGARNTAMQVARGRYIWFVDSDDYIKPNCLKGLLELAEKEDLDVLKFHFSYEESSQMERLAYSKTVESGTDLIFNEESETDLISRCNSAVRQLICKDFLLDNSIEFAEKVQYEDDDFAYQIYAFAKRAHLIPIAPYVVRMTPNSTTRRTNDYLRVKDMYAQAIRVVQLKPILSCLDKRWCEVIRMNIDDSFNNNIFVILKACNLFEKMRFWYKDSVNSQCFKPYLSRKSYAKLRSYICWLILQK